MKEEILQTSLKQFLKHGIREMSIQKLIEPLGISTKTVYKYFKNKEELLEEALHLYHSQQYEILEKRLADQKVVPLLFDIWYTAVQIEYKVNKAFFQDLHYYYPELGQKIEAAISKKFKDQFTHIIKKGIQEGDFEQTMIPEVVMVSILVLYNAIVRTDQFKSFRLSPNDILLNTIAVYIRGFCTRKGMQELDDHIRTFKASGGIMITQKKMYTNHS